ncbi:MAG: RNA polymerase sigma factor, partial [Planctomycetota bacterium]
YLSSALESLPADYETAIRLYDFDGMTIDDVADQMNRSTGAVHMLRARAHDRLRELLGPAIDSLSRLP